MPSLGRSRLIAASSASPGQVPEIELRPTHYVASISASVCGGRARMPEVRINHPANAGAEPLAPDQGKPRPSKRRFVPPQTARRSPDAAQHGINAAEHEYGGIKAGASCVVRRL